MTDKPSNHIIVGKLVHAFIRAGWNPPPPATQVLHHMLDDMAEGRDPTNGDTATTKATLRLSPQQRTVLTLTAMGMPGPDAAQALGISPETVRWNLKKARARLGARTTAQAVAIALRSGIITLGARRVRKHVAA